MDAWFCVIAAGRELPANTVQELDEVAFVRSDDKQAINQAGRMRPDTLARIGGLARYVLDIESQLPAPDARV